MACRTSTAGEIPPKRRSKINILLIFCCVNFRESKLCRKHPVLRENVTAFSVEPHRPPTPDTD